MQKEKHVKSYTRKTKGGKVARVKAYSAKYNATDAIKQNMTRKKGAGDELKAKVAENTPYGFTLKEWDEWYNWDMVGDENNPAALKVQDALIAKMGKRAYNRYLRKCTDSYSEKGSRKEFKSFSEKFPHTESVEPKKETPQVSAPKKKETDTQRILRSPINSGTKPGAIYYIPKGKQEEELLCESDSSERLEIARDWAQSHGGKITREYPIGLDASDRDKKPVEVEKPAKPKTQSWKHVTRVDGKAVRPLNDGANKFFGDIKNQGISLPKGFAYNDISRHDDYGSFTSSDAAAIKDIVSQAKRKKWAVRSFEKDGVKLTSYIAPDSSMRIVSRGTGSRQYATIFATRPVETYSPTPAPASVPKPKQTKYKGPSVSALIGRLPSKNKAGETSVRLSATKRNQLYKALEASGWECTHSSETSGNKFGMFTKGNRTISVNTGKDKFFEDVIIV